MIINTQLLGVEESIANLHRFVAVQEKSIQDALEFILRSMCNYCKDNGPWIDHTGNLRNSISVNIDTMKIWEAAPTKIQALEALKAQNETPVIFVEGDDYIGYLTCGMEYGIWVELKEGFWVIQGAVDRFEPLIGRYFADKMSVEKLDLIAAADIQYSKYLSKKGLSSSEISQRIAQKHEQYGR
jgi:hypothetical protein